MNLLLWLAALLGRGAPIATAFSGRVTVRPRFTGIVTVYPATPEDET